MTPLRMREGRVSRFCFQRRFLLCCCCFLIVSKMLVTNSTHFCVHTACRPAPGLHSRPTMMLLLFELVGTGDEVRNDVAAARELICLFVRQICVEQSINASTLLF